MVRRENYYSVSHANLDKGMVCEGLWKKAKVKRIVGRTLGIMD